MQQFLLHSHSTCNAWRILQRQSLVAQAPPATTRRRDGAPRSPAGSAQTRLPVLRSNQQQVNPAAAPSATAAASSQQQPGPRPVFIEDAGTQAFLDWARQAGIAFAKTRVAAFGGERGLAAAADIAADDVIVSVPRGAALTLPPKQRCPCPDFVAPAYWDASPWFVRLAVRLLHEQRRGPASPLAPWLAQLPRNVCTPASWSAEQLQSLQYAHLTHLAMEQQAEWRLLYEKFVGQGFVGDKAAAPTQQEFVRALALVRSRTFSGPYVASTLAERGRLAGLVAALVAANTALGGELSKGLGAAAAVFIFNILYELLLSNKLRQYTMCPLIDFANHASSNTTEVSYDYPRDAFLLAAAVAYKPGQQVLVSYGAQSNDSLMLLYGFAEPDNPHDTYVMTSLLKWLEQLQPASQARLDMLNRQGLLAALQEVVVTRKGCGPATLQALRYLLAPGSGGSGDGGGLPAGGPGQFASPADAETERKIALVLVHACQQEMGVLTGGSSGNGSSSASSQAQGGNGKRSARGGSSGGSSGGADAAAVAAAAAVFRREKQKVLQACLDELTGSSGAAAAGTADGAVADGSAAQATPVGSGGGGSSS